MVAGGTYSLKSRKFRVRESALSGGKERGHWGGSILVLISGGAALRLGTQPDLRRRTGRRRVERRRRCTNGSSRNGVVRPCRAHLLAHTQQVAYGITSPSQSCRFSACSTAGSRRAMLSRVWGRAGAVRDDYCSLPFVARKPGTDGCWSIARGRPTTGRRQDRTTGGIGRLQNHARQTDEVSRNSLNNTD